MAKRFVSFFAMAFLASATADATNMWLYPWRGVYVPPAVTVTVNHDQSVEQLVQAVEYDEYDLDIPEFPKGPQPIAPEKAACHVATFAPWLSLEEKIGALKGSGLRPATFEELAAFSIEHPEERLKHNLVALGSEWKSNDGRTYVPAIGSYVRPGAHPDEPVWVLYSDPPAYYKKGPNKGKIMTIPQPSLREPTEVRSLPSDGW